jgi:CDP-diglyceride synthetase
VHIDSLPTWALFFATMIVVLIAIEIGYRLGRATHRNSKAEMESPVSAIAGSLLGLAAFMLAFTFSIVTERHDAKKALVREDANAITALGMVGLGYQTGIVGSNRSMARPFLAVSFALVFALIASLDRPDSGIIKVTQQPLAELRDAMAARRQ